MGGLRDGVVFLYFALFSRSCKKTLCFTLISVWWNHSKHTTAQKQRKKQQELPTLLKRYFWSSVQSAWMFCRSVVSAAYSLSVINLGLVQLRRIALFCFAMDDLGKKCFANSSNAIWKVALFSVLLFSARIAVSFDSALPCTNNFRIRNLALPLLAFWPAIAPYLDPFKTECIRWVRQIKGKGRETYAVASRYHLG